MFSSVSTFFRLVVLGLITFSTIYSPIVNCHGFFTPNQIEALCPLNFNALRKLIYEAPVRHKSAVLPGQCPYISEGVHFLRAEYLRTNGDFSPPSDTFQACWEAFRSLVAEFLNGVDLQAVCGYHPEWVSGTCKNITSQAEFESQFSLSGLEEMRTYCNQSLQDDFTCGSCTSKLFTLEDKYLNGSRGNCKRYLFMYAAAIINQLGPTDPSTAKCLFSIPYSSEAAVGNKHKSLVYGVLLGITIGILGASVAIWFLWYQHKKKCSHKLDTKMTNSVTVETSLDFGFGLHRKSTNLIKFRMDEIKKATVSFSRHNIIGKGSYGNVYKGTLTDGSQVAFKRFKNCSASCDAIFVHELEIIASVRHINLVALRGYCMATVGLEGHQRIIVCDLMHNGSLYDHLFGSGTQKLSWPIRQKIALGIARGLAYLHHGVNPAIIHRDIKSSNILLDDTFEPKVADFGLAKFTSNGMTHLSTRVAGTLGYVAPEYALYGMLTERSDVYSYGVVLLELLSGKNAYENNNGEASLLAEWAWSLVKEGKALDVIEKTMPEMGLPDVMELFVHIAVICAHPLLQARPTMEEIVKILESKLPLPVPSSSFASYVSASTSNISSISSIWMSSSSTTSEEPNLDNRDVHERFRVTIA